MEVVWRVAVGDREKNFLRKVEAIRWLCRLTHDSRVRPVVVRHHRGAYTFYGPGRDDRVVRADIDRLGFAHVKPAKERTDVLPGE